MRVQYTLPGFLPAEPPPSEAIEPAGDPFLGRLKFLPLPRALNWKSLLHLDEDPSNPTSIDPPSQPPTLDFRDPVSERWNWTQMLGRLVAVSGTQSSQIPASGADRAVQRMLAMLMNFQEAEDFIAARYLAESEE
jgi:hypothetical protein